TGLSRQIRPSHMTDSRCGADAYDIIHHGGHQEGIACIYDSRGTFSGFIKLGFCNHLAFVIDNFLDDKRLDAVTTICKGCVTSSQMPWRDGPGTQGHCQVSWVILGREAEARNIVL